MPKELLSLGYICQLWQRSPATIEAALRGAKVEPSLRLNELRYYTAGQVERARKVLEARTNAR